MLYRDTVESSTWHVYIISICWYRVGEPLPLSDLLILILIEVISALSSGHLYLWYHGITSCLFGIILFPVSDVSRNMIDTIATFKWTFFFNLKMTKESECKLIFSYFSRIFKNQSELVLIVRGMLLSDWKSPNSKFLRNNQRVREYLILHFLKNSS